MFLLDDLLIGGLRFVLDKVAAVAEQQLDSVETLNRALVDAQAQLEDGTLTEDEFADAERTILARLRALKDEAPGGLADAGSFDGIEVTVDDGGHARR
jgi:hypothetical protein